jgi:hypothetical protein
METDYQKQANDFLNATNTRFTVEFVKHGKHFDSDQDTRDIYKVTLKRNSREFTFDFGQSINNSGECQLVKHLRNKVIAESLISRYGSNYAFKLKDRKNIMMRYSLKEKDLPINSNRSIPNAYDILACLTKSDPGTFEDFCSEFGYDTDSKRAEKTYNAVLNEWKNVQSLFTDKEIEQLQEIQ